MPIGVGLELPFSLQRPLQVRRRDLLLLRQAVSEHRHVAAVGQMFAQGPGGPIVDLLGGKTAGQHGHADGDLLLAAGQVWGDDTPGQALASKAGADPAKVREALLGGFAQSRIMDLHGKRMIERTFQPGFRIRHQQKDLNNALQGARALGLSMPGAAVSQELFNALAAQGDGDLDHSALVLALEKLANHKVAG